MVYSSENKALPLNIKNLFDEVSEKYDFMNTIMSLGLHQYWKKELIDSIPQIPYLSLLDLASGTGDISLSYLKKSQNLHPRITLFDLSPQMIQRSKDQVINKNLKGNLTWKQGEAESLPFEDNSFDVCTVAFGLRNFQDRDLALSEIHRVLKPKGSFLCLEFSKPNPSIASFYNLYSSFIPKIGNLLAKNEAAYTYLVESIKHFPAAEDLKNMIETKGFNFVSYTALTKGITALHRGWK